MGGGRGIRGVNPATQAFPPSHLGIVCKHPLLSVCRRLEALGVIGVIGNLGNLESLESLGIIT